MANILPTQEWFPSTPPVGDGDFQQCPVLVVHYWALWDLIDREMDKRIATLRDEYVDRRGKARSLRAVNGTEHSCETDS